MIPIEGTGADADDLDPCRVCGELTPYQDFDGRPSCWPCADDGETGPEEGGAVREDDEDEMEES